MGPVLEVMKGQDISFECPGINAYCSNTTICVAFFTVKFVRNRDDYLCGCNYLPIGVFHFHNSPLVGVPDHLVIIGEDRNPCCLKMISHSLHLAGKAVPGQPRPLRQGGSEEFLHILPEIGFPLNSCVIDYGVFEGNSGGYDFRRVSLPYHLYHKIIVRWQNGHLFESRADAVHPEIIPPYQDIA